MNVFAIQSCPNKTYSNYKAQPKQNMSISFKSNPTAELTNPALKEIKAVLSTPEVLELSTQLKQEALKAHNTRESLKPYTPEMAKTAFSLVEKFMQIVNPEDLRYSLLARKGSVDPISLDEKQLCAKIAAKVTIYSQRYPSKNNAVLDLLREYLSCNHEIMKQEILHNERVQYSRGLQQFVAGIKQLQELLGVKGGDFVPYDQMIVK